MDRLLDILLVEDNQDIAENVVKYLEGVGCRVDSTSLGSRALVLLDKNQYDILILDVMLPGMDGFTLAKKARDLLQVTSPILFLTARDTLEDKLEGFSSGGDDYLTKPFDLEELEARVEALARRTLNLPSSVIRVGDWIVDTSSFQIYYKDKAVKTTKVGFKIFKALLSSHPNVLLRRDLEKMIWEDSPPDSDALRSHIFSLRKAISTVCEEPIIETLHGIGFRLIVRD